MEKIKKIDIHAHLNVYPQYDFGIGVTVEQLLGLYEGLEVEKSVLLPIVSPEGQLLKFDNYDAISVVEQYPDKFEWFCNVDPRSVDNSEKSDFSKMLTMYKDKGAKGVGEMTSNIYVDDPKMDNLFSYLEEYQMPLLFHMSPRLGFNYGMVDDLGMPRLEKMLKKHKKLKFIGHSQPFWAEMSGDLTEDQRNGFPTTKVVTGRITKLMREYDNLYCDISANSGRNAFMRDREHAISFLTEFSDRIFYGCDICGMGNPIHLMFKEFLDGLAESGELKFEDYKKICRDNAIKLLNLDK